MLKQIKLAMLLVSIIGFIFVVWDLGNLDSEPHLWAVIFPMTVTWIGLWLYLEKQPHKARPWLCYLSIFAMALASADLLTMLAMLGKAEYYLRVYPGIMVLFAYVYGPFAIPVRLGMLFGLLTTVVMLVLGAGLGVSNEILGASVFFLVAINFAGAYTRYQLKAYSRRSLLDKQIAQLERLEADLARHQAEQTGQEITQFIRNSSHNLRQPLQALNSYSTLLETALDGDDLELVRRVALKLIASIDSLSRSFDRLLDISHLVTQKQDVALAEVDLAAVLGRIADQYAPAAERKGILLKVEIAGAGPLRVRSDEIMLQQVIGNLVDNAIKYTAKGWVLVRARLLGGGMARLDIVDTGVGIAEEDQALIFKEFYRTGSSQEYGFGIGLAYVEKAVAKLHGHRLGFYSRKGVGTRFYVQLPLLESRPRPALPSEPAEAAIAGLLVVLVDDDLEVLHAVGDQLEAWGCAVERASCLAEARMALEDNFNEPDLLITDLWLKDGESAEDVIGCFQEHCGPKPVLVITGDTDTTELAARLAGAHVLIKKPFGKAVLLQGIAAALARGPGGGVKPAEAPPGCPRPAPPEQSPGGTPPQSARSFS